jgi:hypothetical protein
MVTASGGRFWREYGGEGTRSILRRFRNRPDMRLEKLDQRLIEAWDAGESGAEEAVDLARWERALSLATDAPFRVALGIRNLERVLPRTRAGDGRGAVWTRVAAYYLKDAWCWSELNGHLESICFHTVSPAMRPFRTEGERPAPDTSISDFYNAIREMVGDETVTPSQLIENLDAISELMPPGSSRRRILASLARDTASPEAAASWLARLGQRFDVLLARSARQRNAAVHGGATSQGVIETVSPFVADLGRRVASGAMEAAANEESLVVWFEQTRLRARERSSQLRVGQPLSEIVGPD